MSYTIIIPRPVQKQLDNLPDEVRRVVEKISLLAEDPRPPEVKKLKGLTMNTAFESETIAFATRSTIRNLLW